jgi:succinate dehydrogenase / fumarate reductase, cytochrome b subunit
VTLHITAAYQLTRMNWQARPVGYESRKNVETSFAALTMRWGGMLLAIFIVFHIAHFTLGAVGFEPGQFKDLHVYENVVAGFSVWPVAVFYIVAMGALCLHLDHGIWSMLQTLGWSTARNTGTLKVLSRIIAIVVFAGFVSVPVAVMTGLVR